LSNSSASEIALATDFRRQSRRYGAIGTVGDHTGAVDGRKCFGSDLWEIRCRPHSCEWADSCRCSQQRQSLLSRLREGFDLHKSGMACVVYMAGVCVQRMHMREHLFKLLRRALFSGNSLWCVGHTDWATYKVADSGKSFSPCHATLRVYRGHPYETR
jgi:hypothetical protein